ncbi:MAG: transposase, partial [Chloroflexi bacterium]|nr:transposase [Chloroflexota bacterium]
VIIEQWRGNYNQIRPHSSLGYKPPTPATFISHTSQLQSAGVT